MKRENKIDTSEKAVRAGRLLIVDDDSITVEAFWKFFQKNGYEATGCTSGKEALEILNSQWFDILLTDLDLKDSETNGIELLKVAKKINPDLVGIIITGHCTEETTAEAKNAGAYALIFKPLRLPSLLAIVSHAIAKNS